jgi:hypothetical protein
MASQLSTALSAPDSEQFEASEIAVTPTPSTSSKARRTSKVWNHTPGDFNAQFFNSTGEKVWRCKYCPKEYPETSGTKTIVVHLLRIHQVQIENVVAAKTLARQTNISELFLRAGDHKRRKLTTEAGAIDGAHLEILYIRWITACGVPFRMVEIEEFRALLLYLNPHIDTFLPSSHSTIRQWVIRTYEAEKSQVQVKLQCALSKVHFTVDLWTSPNSLAILGMIAHYVSEMGVLQQSVVAVKELDGAHSGENQACCVMEVINDYGIASKVGYFVMDNASNNDTMIEALSICMYINTSYFNYIGG